MTAFRLLGAAGLVAVLAATATATALGDLRQVPLACAALLAIAVAGALAVLRAASAHPGALPAAFILGCALLARAVTAFGAPSLSDDEHRYVHEGRAQRIGLATPYSTPPAAIVPAPDDGTTARVNHPDVPAAYPPGTELYFLATVAAGDALGAPRLPMKLGLLAADILVLLWLYRARRQLPLGFVAYGLHPLPLLEVGLSHHVDALGMLFVFVAVVVAKRPRLAGALVGLAMHVKPIGALALLAVEGGRRTRAAVVAGAVALLIAGPHLASGAPLFRGFFDYATRWRASPIVYAALEAPLRPFFDARAAAGVYAHAHVSITPPSLYVEDAGQPLLALGTDAPRGKRVLLDAGFCARLLAGVLLGIALLVVARLATTAASRAAAAIGSAWLLVPTLHPWYLLWVVPLAALTGSRALWTFSALAPLLYQPVFTAAAGGPWAEAIWPRALLLSMTAIAAVLDVRVRSRNRAAR